MSILDNEGHDPNGFGNQPTRAAHREVLCACADSCAKDAEIDRLRAALTEIADPSISWGHAKLIARRALEQPPSA